MYNIMLIHVFKTFEYLYNELKHEEFIKTHKILHLDVLIQID